MDVPYDAEIKRYIRILYAQESRDERGVTVNAFAEAGQCSVNKLTLCPGPIDLEKLQLYGNDDTPISQRFNLQILRCSGYECERDEKKKKAFFKNKLFIARIESPELDWDERNSSSPLGMRM